MTKRHYMHTSYTTTAIIEAKVINLKLQGLVTGDIRLGQNILCTYRLSIEPMSNILGAA